MMMADSDPRVCPRCGSPADDNAYCPECGFDLKAAGELPTRSQWVEGLREPSGEGTPPTPGAAPGVGGEAPSPPPRKGAGGQPWYRQTLPLALIGAAVIAVMVVVIVIASSDDGGGIDRETVQQRLEEMLAARPYGADEPNVECPEDIEVEAGGRFECQADAADGTAAGVEVTVVSTEDEGRYRVENLIPVEKLSTECSQELTEVFREFGTAGSCELECPDLAEADPNGTLTCDLETSDGETGTVKITLASDGRSAQGSWKATLE